MQAKSRRASEGGEALKKLREKFAKPARRQTDAVLSNISRTSSNFRPAEVLPPIPSSAERSTKSFFADAKDTQPFVEKENAVPETLARQSAMPTVGRSVESLRATSAATSRQSVPASPSKHRAAPDQSYTGRSDDLMVSQLVYDTVLEELKRSKFSLERELVALQGSGRGFGDSPRKTEKSSNAELQRLSCELADRTSHYDHLLRQNKDLEQKVSALLELVFTLQKELRHIKELNLKELSVFNG